MTSRTGPERMFHVREALASISHAEVPVVAAVHGAALGTGLALAASCNFIIAADDARLGCRRSTSVWWVGHATLLDCFRRALFG